MHIFYAQISVFFRLFFWVAHVRGKDLDSLVAVLSAVETLLLELRKQSLNLVFRLIKQKKDG